MSDGPSSDKEIVLYYHCKRCIEEKPPSISARDYCSVEVGATRIGLQIWCKRHECNIIHVDFEGQKHPANLNAKKGSTHVH